MTTFLLIWFLVALVVSILFGKMAVARRRLDEQAWREYVQRMRDA